MLQRLPAAALNKTGAFSASRAVPLRAAQRFSLVRMSFWALLPRFGVVLFMFTASRAGSRPPARHLPTHFRSVIPTGVYDTRADC